MTNSPQTATSTSQHASWGPGNELNSFTHLHTLKETAMETLWFTMCTASMEREVLVLLTSGAGGGGGGGGIGGGRGGWGREGGLGEGGGVGGGRGGWGREGGLGEGGGVGGGRGGWGREGMEHTIIRTNW